MIFTQYYAECLSQAAYLIADEATGTGVLVDPLRDVEQYLTDASESGIRIVGVILTHFHADFVAGHLELAERRGAWIGLGRGAVPEFPVRLLDDGERIMLGSTALEIMATPGHTSESISVLVYRDQADVAPESVLTGDALFVGDVGRVDLQASLGADPAQLARDQYDTIQRRLMTLPDEVEVFPAHGAGSACGKNLSEDLSSTIGRERLTNPACAPMPVADFVAYLTDGQPTPPRYFATDAALNRGLRPLFNGEMPGVWGAAQVREFLARGGSVLDVRPAWAFREAHVTGSLNVPVDGRFAETAGMFLDFSTPVLLVGAADRAAEGVRRLARIGFDAVAATAPLEVLEELHELLVETPIIGVAELERLRGTTGSGVLVDVRGAAEFAGGQIPGALNVPLPQLADRVAELPRDVPVVVHCLSGWRSSVASSHLLARGLDVLDLAVGYEGWLTESRHRAA